jgi:poly-gamma-glutamate capsule biosynthesis protein CapA/YwtB (metallophosphatase superfamily)
MNKFIILFIFLFIMGCSNNKIVGSVSESPIKEIKLVNKVQPAETFISEHAKEPITISFVGDIMMDWSVKQAMNQYGVDYPYQEIHEEITKADLAIANVETSITNGGVELNFQNNIIFVQARTPSLD